MSYLRQDILNFLNQLVNILEDNPVDYNQSINIYNNYYNNFSN